MKIPTHVGIIMDGNRRWAKEKGMIPSLGHKAGADNLKKVAEAKIWHKAFDSICFFN